jgi:cytochrome c peroxidase
LAVWGFSALLLLVGQFGPKNGSLLADETFNDEVMRQRLVQLYPQHLPDVDHPWFNPPTPAKIALGRTLFTDPYLSRCGTVACASWHQPGHGVASA